MFAGVFTDGRGAMSRQWLKVNNLSTKNAVRSPWLMMRRGCPECYMRGASHVWGLDMVLWDDGAVVKDSQPDKRAYWKDSMTCCSGGVL